MNARLFLLVAAMLVSATSAHAQTMGNMHHQRGDSAEHAQMLAKLNLTPEQKTKIDAIHAKYAPQMKGGHDSAGMSGMKAMHESDSTMMRGMAEVRAVLRPDQQVPFDSMMSVHMKHGVMHDSSSHHGMKKPSSTTPR